MSTPHVSNIALWKEGVRQEWTAAAAGWWKWHSQMERLSRAATGAIMQAAQVTPGMHVLDLASGTGDPALSLALASTLVLGHLFPRDAARFQGWATEFGESRIWAGIHFRSDIETGYEIGRQVGAAVIERARRDGAE